MAAQTYEIRLRRKNPNGPPGAIVGRLGTYPTQAAAKTDAQRLADKRTFAPGVQITVEPKGSVTRSLSRAGRKSAAKKPGKITGAKPQRKPKAAANPKKRAPASFLRFSGKRYHYFSALGRKKEAQGLAASLRGSGLKVRVVAKTPMPGRRSGYGIYTQPRANPAQARAARRGRSFQVHEIPTGAKRKRNAKKPKRRLATKLPAKPASAYLKAGLTKDALIKIIRRKSNVSAAKLKKLPTGHLEAMAASSTGKEKGDSVRFITKVKDWYPNLFPAWGGVLEVVGPYLAGRPKHEVVVRRKDGKEMAAQKQHLRPASNPRKRAAARRANPKKRTRPKKLARSHKDHKITGSKGKWTVQPYGKNFPTLAKAKSWVNGHVAKTKRGR